MKLRYCAGIIASTFLFAFGSLEVLSEPVGFSPDRSDLKLVGASDSIEAQVEKAPTPDQSDFNSVESCFKKPDIRLSLLENKLCRTSRFSALSFEHHPRAPPRS